MCYNGDMECGTIVLCEKISCPLVRARHLLPNTHYCIPGDKSPPFWSGETGGGGCDLIKTTDNWGQGGGGFTCP